tara:strand:- start:56 stop:241 length:186 start_codon:yes stop_codon:yes gene_type:complete
MSAVHYGATVESPNEVDPMAGTVHAVCWHCPGWRGADWPLTSWGKDAATDEFSEHVAGVHQ